MLDQIPCSDGSPEKFLTTQHERDPETGLDYRFARLYDSDLGRFLGVDPLADTFREWSTYNYAIDNPVLYQDPDGRAASCPTCPPDNWELDATSNGEMGRGLIQSVKDMASGIYELATNPGETIKSIGEAIQHPIQTVENITSSISNAFAENPQYASGYMLGASLQSLVGGSTTKAVQQSKIFPTTNQIAKEYVAKGISNNLNGGKFSVYEKSSTAAVRYDLQGDNHTAGNSKIVVKVPHKQEYKLNVNPANGASNFDKATKHPTPMSWRDLGRVTQILMKK